MFLTGWAYRKRIDIQTANLDANLTDFPLYVKLDADGHVGAKARADGFDIRFTANDGQTLLKYERESWAVAGGKATADFWVKVSLATTGTYIFIYYGNLGAPDGQDGEAVWDANFKAVYHMKDATTSTILDSTGNDNDGAKTAANEPIEADGKIAKGQDFDGTNDYITIPDDDTLDFPNSGLGDLTFGCFYKGGALTTGWRRFLDKTWAGAPTYGYCMTFYLGELVVTCGTRIIYTGYMLPDLLWHHIVVSFDRDGNATTYVDGSPVDYEDITALASSDLRSTFPLSMGTNGGAEFSDATLDEVRVSAGLRTAAWIKFEYRNMAEADNELAWGGEELPPTYANLIASPTAQRDFLLAVEPKERLRGWTKTGGMTYTYEIAWPALYPVAFGDFSGEQLTDGALENWNSATDLTSWTEEKYGTSTIEREATIVKAGTYSVKIVTDASGNHAGIYQVGVMLEAGKRYRYGGWYRTSAGKTAKIWVYGGPSFQISLIGTVAEPRWQAGSGGNLDLPEAADWTYFFVDFDAPLTYAEYLFSVSGDVASATIYFDGLTVQGLPDGYDYRKIYRDLTRILENGTAYTERSSIALVDANAGSYYFDEATSKIYVRCSDSGTADRASIWIVPYFKIYLASGLGKDGRGKIFNGIYYEPIFAAEQLAAITNEQTDFLAGGGLSFGGLELKVANPLRFFDKLWSAWSWKNAAVWLYHGGEDLPLTEYALIYAGTIKEEAWLGPAVSFDTANYLELLKRNVPVNPCFGAAVRQEDLGKPLPLLFGEVFGISPLCTNTAPANATEWTIADPAFQTLKQVVAVYDAGAVVSAGSYTVDLANCKITFSSYTPTGAVTVWAKGAKISDIPGESSTDLLENAADVIRFFLKRILGLGDSQISTSAFTAAKAALADLPVCKLVRFRRNLATYITELERSTLSVLYQDNDGKIGLAAFDPFFVPVDTIANEELAAFKQTSPSDKLYAGVKVYYNPRPFDRPESGGVEGEDDSFDVVEGLNTGARYLDGSATSYRRIVSWLKTATAAAALRDRVLFLTNQAPIELELEIAGGKLFRRRPGELLAITRTKAPSSSGRMEAQIFQILSIEKRLAENRVMLKLDNLNGTAYRVGMWCLDAAPAWASASAQQRDEQGFWTDDDGLVVAGDWTTADKSVWW